MGGMSGLNTALSALYAARNGLETAGQNIANVNTDGYHRQRTIQQSIGAAITPAFYAKTGGIGQGVRVADVQRMSDQFLETRSLSEHASQSSLTQTQGVLARIELAFAEPGDSGLQSQMSDFWSSWDDVANHPDDLAARTQLLEQAHTVINSFSQASTQLASLQQTSTDQISAKVAEINDLGARIADLNHSIANATNAGMHPNDLIDQRDSMLSKLAGDIGVTTRPGPAGTVDVFIGNQAIVQGSISNAMRVDLSASPVVGLKWDINGASVSAKGGEVGGLVSTVNDIIPRFQAAVDGVAQKMVATVNTQHALGVDLLGGTGANLFDPAGTTAGTIALNPLVDADPRLVAAGQTGGGTLDGHNALLLAELATSPTGPDLAYRQLIDGLGVEAQRANRQVDIQSAITAQVDGAKEGTSGVNLDEEMTNMVAYQHAYDAAARFMTSIDSLLDTVIHGTGLVGR